MEGIEEKLLKTQDRKSAQKAPKMKNSAADDWG
jgi:hypothetical protein